MRPIRVSTIAAPTSAPVPPPGGANAGKPAPANAVNASTSAMAMRARIGTVRSAKSGATEQSAVHRNSTSRNPNRVGVRKPASMGTNAALAISVPEIRSPPPSAGEG